MMPQKYRKQAEAKGDGVINPQIYNFNQFQTLKTLMLSKCYESNEVYRGTWLHMTSGTLCFTSSDTYRVNRLLLRIYEWTYEIYFHTYV